MIQKTYKAYLFDFDYTLADSSRGIVMCFRNVLAMHGHDGISDEAIKRTIGKTLEESFTILTGIDDKETLAAYRKEYVAQADKLMTANTVLFPETLDVLSRLKDRGAKIGIISTKYRYSLDIIVGGEDVKTPKPSPEGLMFAIGRLGLETADVLYCGDSTVDAETARNAGADFAGVLHGMTTRYELEMYPHVKIMDTLDEIL